jgi:hypothetical protein
MAEAVAALDEELANGDGPLEKEDDGDNDDDDNGANDDGCNGAKGMRKAPTAKERRATKTASKKQVCMPTPAAALPTLCSTLC